MKQIVKIGIEKMVMMNTPKSLKYTTSRLSMQQDIFLVTAITMEIQSGSSSKNIGALIEMKMYMKKR